MELNYKIQTYEWGKRGPESKVATLFANVNDQFTIENKVPYSELWLGTHVNGPSSLKNGTPLANLVAEHPEYLGDGVRKKFGDQLPFLFKVLSVNQALSIQAHPTKQHAEELHRLRPDLYKDPNHKPEMAIALTPFEALCGFRPAAEIEFFLKNIPELQALVGKHSTESLKEAFRTVLTSPKDVIGVQLKKLIQRLKTLDSEQRKQQLADLIEKLHHHYPDDVGCFVAYFLNYLKLQPFEAIYLGPNVPHAYIYGDCVECMACSDNVVRAGLTPKYIDVETLCAMLDYKGEKAEAKIFKPVAENDLTTLFKPPVPDFAVVQIKVPRSAKSYKVIPRSSASILIVIGGKAKLGDISLIPGAAIFLPAGSSHVITDIKEDLLIYQGLANV